MKNNFFTLLVLFLFLGACRPPSSELTVEEQDLVDTLYNRQFVILRAELDSLCDAQHDSLRQRAVDSLVDLQLTEIKKLKSRE